MPNLVTFTVRGIDDTGTLWTKVKAEAVEAGAEAARAYDTAFRANSGSLGSGIGASGSIGGSAGSIISGDESSIVQHLRSYANSPGGIGIIGTGNDSSLLSMLKSEILRSSANGGLGLLSGDGGVDTQDLVTQVLTGQGPSDVSTEDMIKEVLTNNVTGNVNTDDFIKQVLTGSGPKNTSTTDTIHTNIDDESLNNAENSVSSAFAHMVSDSQSVGSAFDNVSLWGEDLARSTSDFFDSIDNSTASGFGDMKKTILSFKNDADMLKVQNIFGIDPAEVTAEGEAIDAAMENGMKQMLRVSSDGNVWQDMSGGSNTSALKNAADKDASDFVDSFASSTRALMSNEISGGGSGGGGGLFSGLFGGGNSGIEKDGEDAGDDFVNGVAHSIKGGGGGEGEGLMESISGLSEYLIPALVGIVAVAAPFLAQAMSGMLVGALGGGIVAMAIAGAAKSKQVVAVFDTLKKNASDDLTEIGSSFVPVVSSILTNADKMLGKLTPDFASAAKTMSKPFEDLSDTIIDDLGSSAIQNSIKTIATDFGKIANAVTPAFAGAMNSVANGITQVANSVAKNPQSMADFVTNMGKIAGAALDLIADLTKVGNYLEKEWPGFWSDAKTPVTDTWKIITSTVSSSVGTIEGLIKVFAGVLTGNWTAAWNGVKQTGDSIWKGITGSFGPFLSGLEDLAKNGWAKIVPVFANGENDVESGVHKLWSTVANYFTEMASQSVNEVKSWWSETETAVKNGWGDVGSFLSGIPSKVKGYFSGASGYLVSAGKDIIGGLYGGIKDGLGDVSSWVSGNIVNPIVNAVKHLFGINSPSTVMAALGIHLPGGLFKGIITGAQGIDDIIKQSFGSMPNALLHLLEKGFISAGDLPSKALSALKSLGSGALSVLKGLGGDIGSIWTDIFGGGGSGGGSSLNPTGTGSTVQALMKSMAASVGWTGAEWTALDEVEEREAGFNLTATNPSSGAYGLAQFIDGASEYAQYGGNSTTAAGQITGMLNYIKDRYGTPEAAEAHELAYGWYDHGGWLQPGYTLAYNGTGSPERVGMGGGVEGGVTLEIAGSSDSTFDAMMLEWIRNKVRIKGGGSVQNAFGRT